MPSFCYSGFKISVSHFCVWYAFVDILTTTQPGRTKNRKVTTKLMNDFFQRDLEEKEDTSEKDQKMNRLVKWWVGTKTFPLVDHSVEDEKNIRGPQQHQNKLPWGTGIWTAFWLLWIAIIAGIYPIYPNTPVEVHTPGQTEQKGQTKGKIEALITEQSGSQAPNVVNLCKYTLKFSNYYKSILTM